jgi:hypothetical protein
MCDAGRQVDPRDLTEPDRWRRRALVDPLCDDVADRSSALSGPGSVRRAMEREWR